MELNDKKINILGDSITQGIGASVYEKSFPAVLAAKTGAIVRNYGMGGTRIAKQKKLGIYEGPDVDYNGRAPQMDDDADIVLVFGGTNDFGHGDAPFGEPGDRTLWTFCGGMRLLMESLRSKYPDSLIVVMTPTHRSSENVTVNEIGIPCRRLIDYVNAEKEIAGEYGIPVLDMWNECDVNPLKEGHTEKYMPDGLHPNDAGHEKIADTIIEFFKNI